MTNHHRDSIKPDISAVSLEEQLRQVLAGEDPRNPLTDEKIGELLHLRRERIVELRLSGGIEDSRVRRREALLGDAKQLLNQNPALSSRGLTYELNQMGYALSRYVAKAIREEVLALPEEESNHADFPARKAHDPLPGQTLLDEGFQSIIGWNGGLKIQVNQAKAAVLYPPNGLNTLIIGPSGTGKTFLAENMYRFAVLKGVLAEDAPFVVFNCADYADNPQLLISQLFGHVKGAYSGATDSKKGLVETAQGGILLLDEIHRLPSEGQELLFYLLDKGEFHRLGDTGPVKRVNVRVIAATTENPESSLLLTFRRRIPMIITMPPLNERPFWERYTIVRNFFYREAVKINRRLVVEADAIKMFLLCQCGGNVGQLCSDIQVACAEAFLSSISKNQDEVRIVAGPLQRHLRIDPILLRRHRGEAEQYAKTLVADPNHAPENALDVEQNTALSTSAIYELIETTFEELRKNGMGNEEAFHTVHAKINDKMGQLGGIQTKFSHELTQLEAMIDTMVNKNIIDAVRRGAELAREEFPLLESNFYCLLAIHLNTVIENLRDGTYLPKEDLQHIRQSAPREYQVALAMLAQISSDLGLELPTAEGIIIAMYLKTFTHTEGEKPDGKIRVLILTHGRVGVSMAEVVNTMCQLDSAVGIELGLEESPEVGLERAISVVRQTDEGKGCLLLVDMGSLASFSEEITRQTGIAVRCVARVDTLMALDAVRRAALNESSLDSLAEILEAGRYHVGFSDRDAKGDKPPALITLCITGEGNARRLKDYLDTSMPWIRKRVKIFELGLLDRQELALKMERISQEYRVLGVVGTMDPGFLGIPFLPVDYVLSGKGTLALNTLLSSGPAPCRLGDITEPQLLLCNPEETTKNGIIDQLTAQLVRCGCVTEDFLLSVYKRENLGTTCLAGGIAIPHGDSNCVTKPAIAVAKLVRPVEWEAGFVADLVFLFAFDEKCAPYVENFYQLTEDKKRLESLRKAASPEELQEILSK